MKLTPALISLLLSMSQAFGPSVSKSNAAPTREIGANKMSNLANNQEGVHATFHRKKWGVDNEYAHEYWFNSRIHTLGNRGFWGAIHAAVSPIAVKLIDVKAYDGVDVRKKVRAKANTQSKL